MTSLQITQDLTHNLVKSLQTIYPNTITEPMTCVEIGPLKGRVRFLSRSIFVKIVRANSIVLTPWMINM